MKFYSGIKIGGGEVFIIKSLAQALQIFEENSIKNAEHTEEGNYKLGNNVKVN